MAEKGGERGGGEGGELLFPRGHKGGAVGGEEGGTERKGEEEEKVEGIVKGGAPWGGVETEGEGGVEQETEGREAEVLSEEEVSHEISPPAPLRIGGGEED